MLANVINDTCANKSSWFKTKSVATHRDAFADSHGNADSPVQRRQLGSKLSRNPVLGNPAGGRVFAKNEPRTFSAAGRRRTPPRNSVNGSHNLINGKSDRAARRLSPSLERKKNQGWSMTVSFLGLA